MFDVRARLQLRQSIKLDFKTIPYQDFSLLSSSDDVADLGGDRLTSQLIKHRDIRQG